MKVSRRLIVVVCVAVVAAVSGLIIWLVVGGRPAGPDFSEKKPEEIREYLRSEAFRNMDREARRGIARRAMEQMMTGRARAYFELPVEERAVYLDKIIDEMESRRREFRSMRGEFGRWRRGSEERRGTREGRGERTRFRRDGRRGQGPPRWRAGRRGRRWSAERRRARREFVDPRTRAIRAKFREALRRRMRERGMDFGRRGRG